MNGPPNINGINLTKPIIVGNRQPQITPNNPATFEQLLRKNMEQTSTLTFSKHAAARAQQRGISITAGDIQRLSGAIGKADEKGLKDTLVLMDNTAYIVNIPGRVVVTMMQGTETSGSVFTNIDGAVIV
jgi:flagellar operon protein